MSSRLFAPTWLPFFREGRHSLTRLFRTKRFEHTARLQFADMFIYQLLEFATSLWPASQNMPDLFFSRIVEFFVRDDAIDQANPFSLHGADRLGGKQH